MIKDNKKLFLVTLDTLAKLHRDVKAQKINHG